MNSYLKSSVSAATLSLFLAAPAFAADVYNGGLKDSPSADAAPSGRAINWNGIYLGGQVGYGNANHKLEGSESYTTPAHCTSGALSGDTCVTKAAVPAHCSDATKTVAQCTGGDRHVIDEVPAVTDSSKFVDAVTETVSEFLDGLNSHGVFGGGTVGADIQRGHLLFGVFGDYNISGLKTSIGGSDSADIDIIEEGDSWVVAARAGYLFGEEKRALLYVLGGYGQTDVTYAGIGTDGGDKDVTFSGFVAGAGGEYALSQNVFLGIEWQHFFGSTETLASATSENELVSAKITDEMDTDKVMAKLKVKFGGNLPYIGD